MVFLASHVVCSGMSSLQYSLLRILNDSLIERTQAVKLKAQSLEPLLERCKNADFVTALLNQEPKMDATDFKILLVCIISPGSSVSEINLLLDLVRLQGPLSISACQQLSTVFPTVGHATQLQIARLLMNQLEIAPPVLHCLILLTSGSCKNCLNDSRLDQSSDRDNALIARRREDSS